MTLCRCGRIATIERDGEWWCCIQCKNRMAHSRKCNDRMKKEE